MATGRKASGPGRGDDRLKRLFDVMAAAVGLVGLSPALVGIALAIRLQDGGPVLYLGSRVGRGGRPFRLVKFRTMVVNADRIGPGLTATGDRRVTPVGRWLRRRKLDELPQLWNVLLGDMSMVGPRPEDPRYVALYTSEQRRVLRVRPGITSAASLAYRDEERMLSGPDWETYYRTEVMPAKLKIEVDYLARRNLMTDLGIIARTVAAMFR